MKASSSKVPGTSERKSAGPGQSFLYADCSKLLDDYKCRICKLPLFDPVTSHCHMFCRACIAAHTAAGVGGKQSSPCPACQQPLGPIHDVLGPLAKPMLKELDQLWVYCPYRAQHGCQVICASHC